MIPLLLTIGICFVLLVGAHALGNLLCGGFREDPRGKLGYIWVGLYAYVAIFVFFVIFCHIYVAVTELIK
jgi:hypothetical protein